MMVKILKTFSNMNLFKTGILELQSLYCGPLTQMMFVTKGMRNTIYHYDSVEIVW